MRRSGIYRIDLGNRYFYVGSSAHLNSRRSQHLSDLKRGVHGNLIMQRNWNKYHFFVFSVVELCDVDDLLTREQVMIDTHWLDRRCVNMTPTAGSTRGKAHSLEARIKMSVTRRQNMTDERRSQMSVTAKNISAETRAKMSVAAKRRPPRSAETQAKMSAANRGKVRSPETRAKISANNRKWIRSPEMREKLSVIAKNRYYSPETRAKLSEKSTGRVYTPETCAKLSRIKKDYWARVRMEKMEKLATEAMNNGQKAC